MFLKIHQRKLDKVLSRQIGDSGNQWRPRETEMKQLSVDNADDVLNSTRPKRNTNKVNEKALCEGSHILIGFYKLY